MDENILLINLVIDEQLRTIGATNATIVYNYSSDKEA